jgi:predicted esterase YcpF (UPF0227 family)
LAGDPFFYFNGFNSAIPDDYSGNAKIVAVAELANNRDYDFVPVTVCYRRALEQAGEVLAMVGKSANRAVFSGSSMGGWFARIVQLQFAAARPEVKTAAIAFNPAYDLSMYGHLLLGKQRNHVTHEEYLWTVAHSSQLRALETSVRYGAPQPFFVFVDKGDEVIGWERSSVRHAPISRFVAFEGGCHSFDHFREALADFDSVFHG